MPASVLASVIWARAPSGRAAAGRPGGGGTVRSRGRPCARASPRSRAAPCTARGWRCPGAGGGRSPLTSTAGARPRCRSVASRRRPVPRRDRGFGRRSQARPARQAAGLGPRRRRAARRARPSRAGLLRTPLSSHCDSGSTVNHAESPRCPVARSSVAESQVSSAIATAPRAGLCSSASSRSTAGAPAADRGLDHSLERLEVGDDRP
jgi:hypothetical protein